MRKHWFLFILIFCFCATAFADGTSFKIRVPDAVVKGERFRLEYILTNEQGREIQIPDAIKGFDILFGPGFASMSNTQFINGRASSSYTETYTYTLIANEIGTFQMPSASIKVDGKTIKSNATQLKVLPPDKNAQPNAQGTQTERITSSSTMDKISPSDAFIRAIVSKTKVHEQEAFIVTFRFYTTLDALGVEKVEFPEFEGFMVEDMDLSDSRQMSLEHFNGRNYYSLDFKKSLLFPQRSGKITIPSGKVEVVFRVKSGKKVQGFMQQYDVMTNAKKMMTTNPLTIDISPLPEGKPISYANAVGSFDLKTSISAEKVKANEAVTIKLDINGVGNMKLLQTPEFKLPTDFETYDPTITNNLKITTNGLSGKRTIEYMFIPRHAGNYTIPATDFSYYDPTAKAYKTLSTPEYKLEVAKDPNANLNTGTSYNNQTDVQVKQDIRYLKTGNYSYNKENDFLIGSTRYYLWYLLPTLLFLTSLFVYRKQIQRNADVSRMKIRKANKIAVKRLKIAGEHLAKHNKEKFYEEVLRATWGYLSDKLAIPGANLNRDNIEVELNKYGASENLVSEFISILDTCEYARYSPQGLNDNQAMDNFYNNTLETIGKMENTIKIK